MSTSNVYQFPKKKVPSRVSIYYEAVKMRVTCHMLQARLKVPRQGIEVRKSNDVVIVVNREVQTKEIMRIHAEFLANQMEISKEYLLFVIPDLEKADDLPR